jgi:hypothetical protein
MYMPNKIEFGFEHTTGHKRLVIAAPTSEVEQARQHMPGRSTDFERAFESVEEGALVRLHLKDSAERPQGNIHPNVMQATFNIANTFLSRLVHPNFHTPPEQRETVDSNIGLKKYVPVPGGFLLESLHDMDELLKEEELKALIGSYVAPIAFNLDASLKKSRLGRSTRIPNQTRENCVATMRNRVRRIGSEFSIGLHGMARIIGERPENMAEANFRMRGESIRPETQPLVGLAVITAVTQAAELLPYAAQSVKIGR